MTGLEGADDGHHLPANDLTHSLATLGFDPVADIGRVSLRDIRRAYYRTIQKYHPDKYSSLPAEFQKVAETKTRELNAAYVNLVKFKKREPAPFSTNGDFGQSSSDLRSTKQHGR